MKRLLLFFTFAFGCGIAEGNASSVQQAFTNEGQVCGGTYDPFSVPWPTHGWCQWMTGIHGTSSPPCSTQPSTGEIYIYDGTNRSTSRCARIPVDTFLDWTYIAVNGWNSILNGNKTTIKTIWVGPHTLWQFSNDPEFNNSSMIANYTDTANNWIYNPQTNYDIASSANLLYNGGPLD